MPHATVKRYDGDDTSSCQSTRCNNLLQRESMLKFHNKHGNKNDHDNGNYNEPDAIDASGFFVVLFDIPVLIPFVASFTVTSFILLPSFYAYLCIFFNPDFSMSLLKHFILPIDLNTKVAFSQKACYILTTEPKWFFGHERIFAAQTLIFMLIEQGYNAMY